MVRVLVVRFWERMVVFIGVPVMCSKEIEMSLRVPGRDSRCLRSLSFLLFSR